MLEDVVGPGRLGMQTCLACYYRRDAGDMGCRPPQSSAAAAASIIDDLGSEGKLDPMGAIRQPLPMGRNRPRSSVAAAASVCQKVIHPQRCVEQSCPFLYAYQAFGRSYAAAPRASSPSRSTSSTWSGRDGGVTGSGSIRAVREPLPMCPAEVERAYEHRQEPLGCINPEFHELPDRPSFRVIENRRPSR